MALTDRKLANLARKRQAASKVEGDGKKERQRLDKIITKELRTRGTKSITTLGLRITRRHNTYHRYDYWEAVAVLGRKQANRLRKDELDPDKVLAAIERGDITKKQVKKFYHASKSDEYASVVPVK